MSKALKDKINNNIALRVMYHDLDNQVQDWIYNKAWDHVAARLLVWGDFRGNFQRIWD